jgi:LytS/YehU family sensor histidine kinase
MDQKIYFEKLSSKRTDILLHILFWILFYLYLVWDDYFENPLYIVLFDSLIYFLITSLLVYVNIFLLVPKLLYEKKYLFYFACFVILLCIGSASKVYAYTYIIPSDDLAKHSVLYMFFNWLFRTLFELTGISSIKIIHDRIVTTDRLQRAEKQRHKAELKFLKAQVNPHFLFNTLNNIFFLIKKNPEKASDSVLKLSEMLRFRLYEIGNTQISIEKEIEYIRNYIELEKLRSEDKVSVEFTVKGETHVKKIEPFIFLDFVENAFKHNGAKVERRGWIKITFNVKSDSVVFRVENSKNEAFKNSNENKGIGILNIRHRLNLLYPQKYKLNIHEDNNTYIADLTIEL